MNVIDPLRFLLVLFVISLVGQGIGMIDGPYAEIARNA